MRLAANNIVHIPGLEFIGVWDLMGKQSPLPKWATPALVPEGVRLIVGKPKVGKSWFVLGLGIAVASGGMAPGCRRGSRQRSLS